MSKELLAIKAAIYEVGLLFNQAPSEEKINAYAKALQNYNPKQITHAFNQVILSGSAFFPSLAEVLTHLKPREISSEDIANNVANEIVAKTLEWGCHRLKEAYESLSELAKDSIGANTYLLYEVVNGDKSNLPALRAQIRGMVKASVETKRSCIQNQKLVRLGIGAPGALDKTNGLRVLRFDDFSETGEDA